MAKKKAAKLKALEAEAAEDFLEISHCIGCNAHLINGVYDASGVNVGSSVQICTAAIQYDPVTKQKNVTSAEKAYLSIVEDFPDSEFFGAANYRIGSLTYANNEFKRASTYFNEAIVR